MSIGDILRLNSRVIYCDVAARPHPLVHVDVEAVILRPEQRDSFVSNTFSFTFACETGGKGKSATGVASAAGGGEGGGQGGEGSEGAGLISRVLPSRYGEALRMAKIMTAAAAAAAAAAER